MASIAVGSPTGTRVSPQTSDRASPIMAAAAVDALAELASRTWEPSSEWSVVVSSE